MKTKEIWLKMICVLSALMVCTAVAFTFASCGSESHSLEAEVYNFYDDGEQTAVLNLTDGATFKSEISTSDVEFKGALVGRTATKVEWLSEKQIRLTLNGKCTAVDISTETAIIIKANAVSSSKDYYCDIITVEEADLVTTSITSGGVLGGEKSYTEAFVLNSGNFIPANLTAENIKLTNATENAEMAISYNAEKKELTVKVTKFNSAGGVNPIIEFSSKISDLNKTFTKTMVPFSI